MRLTTTDDGTDSNMGSNPDNKRKIFNLKEAIDRKRKSFPLNWATVILARGKSLTDRDI